MKAFGAQDPNRVIVFDSPPLLSTSEAKALCSYAGQIAMVVAAIPTDDVPPRISSVWPG